LAVDEQLQRVDSGFVDLFGYKQFLYLFYVFLGEGRQSRNEITVTDLPLL